MARDRVLVIEDDLYVRRYLHRALTQAYYQVFMAESGEAGITLAAANQPSVILLDVMLPDLDGVVVCARLRELTSAIIIMLTAKTDLRTRVTSLNLGADDYLTKPFEPKELVLRIQSILKRARPAAVAAEQRRVVKFGAFLFELERRRLFRGEEPVYLTEAETDLLAQLAARAGEALSREELSTAPENGEVSAGRQVDVQVTRLRRKIEDDPRFPRHLQTVRGRGYMLQPD